MCASCWAVTAASVMGDRLNILIESARQRQSQEGEPRQHQGQQQGQPLGRAEVSAQYLLNCVPGQRHCGYPGSSSAAMAFVAAHGIPDEACAPWQGEWPAGRQQCDPLHICAEVAINPRTHDHQWPNHTKPQHMVPVPNPRMYRVEKDTRIPPNDTQAIMAALQSGPVACGVHAQGLVAYTGGVLMEAEHPGTSDDHSVAIVGYGEEDGTPYWVVSQP